MQQYDMYFDSYSDVGTSGLCIHPSIPIYGKKRVLKLLVDKVFEHRATDLFRSIEAFTASKDTLDGNTPVADKVKWNKKPAMTIPGKYGYHYIEADLHSIRNDTLLILST